MVAVLGVRRVEHLPLTGLRLRLEAIDLTRFFCGRRWCWPVVGGVLVHRDEAHITRTYAETLAPYLARAYDRLSAGGGVRIASRG